MIDEKKIIKWAVNPYMQGVFILALIIVFNLLFYIGKGSGVASQNPNKPYIVSTAMLLFYAILNSIISIKADSLISYWGKSITTYIGILVIGTSFSYLISGLTIDEAGSFRWLFIVLTMGYFIFLAIVQSMKKIVDVAIKQDKRLRNEE